MHVYFVMSHLGMESISQHVWCVEPFGHGGDLLIIYVCVLCSYIEPFRHGGDLLV